MDIASVSMALANIDLQTKVGTAVLSDVLDRSETLTAGMVEMIDAAAMEQSVNPHLGGNVDIRI